MVPQMVPLVVWVNHGAALGLPRVRAAVDVDDVPALGMLQVLADLHAAPTRVANDVDIAIRVDLIDTFDEISHWDVGGALGVLGIPFVVLADVDELGVFRYFGGLYVLHAHQLTRVPVRGWWP